MNSDVSSVPSSPVPLPLKRQLVQPLQRNILNSDSESPTSSSDPSPINRDGPRLPWAITTKLPFNPHTAHPILYSHTPKTSLSNSLSVPAQDYISHLIDERANKQLIKRFIPKTFKEARSCAEREQWRIAIQKEIDALKANGTWALVSLDSLPHGSKPIGGKWVFDIKWDGRYKARFVIKGYAQKYGRDYTETFAPVVNTTSIRILMSLCVENKLRLRQFDIPNAFLKGNLTEEVYMYQPEGFVEGHNLVCKLIKTLYGLKQASKEFYEVLRSYLSSIGFIRNDVDQCVYTKTSNEGTNIIGTHVDDGFFFGTNQQQLRDFELSLYTTFECECHDANNLLGMRIEQSDDNSILYTDLEEYTSGILNDFQMQDCKPVSTPINSSLPLSTIMTPLTDLDKIYLRNNPFRSIVGSLLYLAIQARPDILVAVNRLSAYQEHPQHEHLIAAKRVLRYLKGTLHFKLIYNNSNTNASLNLTAYADADWAGCPDTRRSTTGYICYLGPHLISWFTCRQKVVSLSTTESEYYSTTDCAKEILYCRQFIGSLHCFGYGDNSLLDNPTSIKYVKYPYCELRGDNQGCLQLAKHPTSHKRTKHIDIKHHFIREKIENKIISLKYVDTC